LIEFPLRQQKSLCCLLSALIFLLHTLHTLVFYLEVNFIFQLVSELGTLCVDLILEGYFFLTSILCLKLLILNLPLMVRTMAIGRHVCVSFLNLLTVGVLLKLVRLNQRMQHLN
jgi:hypothetical protein